MWWGNNNLLKTYFVFKDVSFLIVQVFLAFTDKLNFLVQKQHQTMRYCNTEPEHEMQRIVKLLQLPQIVTRLKALLLLSPVKLLQSYPLRNFIFEASLP